MLEINDNTEVLIGEDDDTPRIEDFKHGQYADKHPAIKFTLENGRDHDDPNEVFIMPNPTVAVYEITGGYMVLLTVEAPDMIVYQALKVDDMDKEGLKEFLTEMLDGMDDDLRGIASVGRFDGRMGYEEVKAAVQEKVDALVAAAEDE